MSQTHKFDLKITTHIFKYIEKSSIRLVGTWLILARQFFFGLAGLDSQFLTILSITTHIWKHLAPLLFDCNERFPHRNSNKLIICSYRIHSEPWCETQMLVSISFQSIHKRFVCGTGTRCLSLNNDTLFHLTETVETAMTSPFHE